MGLAFASAEELLDYVETVFPQVRGDFALEHLDERSILLRLRAGERHLRPGGTVSGPAMFGLADCCGYLMTLARIGPVPLAVTTSASIDFMRKPPPGDLLGEGRLLKLGRLLSVTDVLIRAEGQDEPVARATVTYAIPPGAAAQRR